MATTTHSQVTPGVAGRTNYDKWDKVTRDLVSETEQTEKDEEEATKTALGLDGKYARSQAEAEEREKAEMLKKTKAKLDKFKNRQESFVQTFENVLNDGVHVFRLTRDHMDAFKRVVMIRDVTGTSPSDSKLVLTQDLSLLESQVPASALRNPKSYPDDAENSVPTENDKPTHVHGLIKLVLENIENCTVMIKCKFITGTVEFHRCRNMHIICDPTAVVTTIQADLSENVTIQFRDPGTNPKLFHAGVSQMSVQLERDGIVESSVTADYEQDGAEAVGAATKEEFRFVTQLVDGVWVTEKVIKADTVALTERDLQKEKERRAQATKMATAMAEDMIKVKDKDGNELVTKSTTTAPEEDDVVEEVLTDSIKFALEECVQFKARGNEAFAAGEYGQAILQYSLALDKSTQLGDDKLFPLDVIYGNRSACFLKLGQHEKAEADARSSLEINPDYIKAQFRLGLALHAMKRYEEALPILASAHKMEPKNQHIKQALQFCEVRMEQEIRKRMQT
jgi:Flp pilus assembly protein TadD